MKQPWLPDTILRAASLLTPAAERDQWMDEWRSELWYIPRDRATRFSLGAFRDALWMRRATPFRFSLDTPAACLGWLALCASSSLAFAVALAAALKSSPLYAPLGLRDLAPACLIMLGVSALLMPAVLAITPRAPRRFRPRGLLFLALKTLLVQPLLLCLMQLWIVLAPALPFAPLPLCAASILVLRWVITDQVRRCPVCLRALTSPVRIGSPSETFLEWYGDESACSRGHGLLQASAGETRWLRLDDSWSGLFWGRLS